MYVKIVTKTPRNTCYIFTNKQKYIDTNVKHGIVYA